MSTPVQLMFNEEAEVWIASCKLDDQSVIRGESSSPDGALGQLGGAAMSHRAGLRPPTLAIPPIAPS